MPDQKAPEQERSRAEGCLDEEIIGRVLGGEVALFELLMRRHNQRIYRAIRSILREDSEPSTHFSS